MTSFLHFLFPTTDRLENPKTYKNFVTTWLLISLFFHLLTAYFSVGYHSPDEQFQILEFLAYKLGKASVSELAIEFSEKIRPWTQIGIYWAIVQVSKLVHIQSPFSWAFEIRVFTGLLGWLSSVAMAVCTQFWFKDVRARRFSILAISLLWFIPLLHVRPSSESLGGTFFLLGLCLASWELYHRIQIRSWLGLCVGILFGLSFECRFQMGIMVAGFYAWLLLASPRESSKRNFIFASLMGLLATFSLGRAIDYWGYGQWVLSPWNYFYFNLVRGEVNRYSTTPWWDIFRVSFTETWPVLGLLVAFSYLLAWIRYPKHPLTWSMVPFFLVHEWIPHKELRFFFPMAASAPVVLTMALYAAEANSKHWVFEWDRVRSKWWVQWPWRFLVFNNLIALFALMFIPLARTVQFYEGLYKSVPKTVWESNEPVSVYYKSKTRNPYEVLGIQIRFYRPDNLILENFKDPKELLSVLDQSKKSIFIFHTGFELPENWNFPSDRCQMVFRTLPSTAQWVNFGDWISRANVWSLYRCSNPSSPGEAS